MTASLPPNPPHPRVAPDANGSGLDPRALAKLRELDPDGRHGVLPRVLGAYEASLLRFQPQVADVWARRDRKAIGDMAHTLKSSSASVGALALSALCADIERSVRAGDTLPLDAQVIALQEEAARVLVSVRAMLRA